MPTHDLTISCGNQILLDIQDGCATHGELKYMRPLTPDALKIAVGLCVDVPTGFDDKKAFESVSKQDDFVMLHPDETGQINQQDPGFIRALISSITDLKKIPDQVCIEKHHRDLTPDDTTRKWRLPKISSQVYMVPKWIVDLQIIFPLVILNNITVEKNATLSLGQNVTALTVDNIYIYQGGSIIQNAPNLTVSVTGEVTADL